MSHDIEILHLEQFSDYLQARPRDFHKGNAGHVLIVGGDSGFSGAVRMAAEAAYRVGAGLVSIATRAEHAALMNIARPEIMSHGIQHANDLKGLLAKADVVVAGPGLGKSAWSRELFAAILTCQQPLLLDADALNLLAEHPRSNTHWILTPHAGEAGRLLNMTSSEIQANRLEAIQQLQKKYQGVCVLKGFGSLVLGVDALPSICHAGNPGMATAGMGDVLSGVIGGLLAQGVPPLIATKLGVLLHAMAGDLAAKEGQRGMMAMDLMPYLRYLVNGMHE